MSKKVINYCFISVLKKFFSAIEQLGTPLDMARALVKSYGRWLFRTTTELQVELQEGRFGIVLSTPRLVLPLANIGLLKTKPRQKDIVAASHEARLLKATALARATTTTDYIAAANELKDELQFGRTVSAESQESVTDPLDQQPGPSYTYTTTPRRRRIIARKIEF